MSSHWLSWTCTRVTCSYGFELITWSMVTASVQLGSPWLQWNASTTATSEISTIHGQCLWWDANTVTTYNSSGLSGGNEKNADNFKKSVSCGHFRAHCLKEMLFMHASLYFRTYWKCTRDYFARTRRISEFLNWAQLQSYHCFIASSILLSASKIFQLRKVSLISETSIIDLDPGILRSMRHVNPYILRWIMY